MSMAAAVVTGTRRLSFSNSAGSREFDLYVPVGLTGRPALLVMLHGGQMDAAEFAVASRMNDFADRHGFLVAYPEQSREANASGYWNWFRPEDQQADGGEPSIIAGITRQIMAEWTIDPDRVWIAGLSAGGAMAAVMTATHPQLYTAAGVHSGLPYQAARDVGSAFAAMSIGRDSDAAAGPAPLIVLHGDRDTTVVVSNADRLIDARLATHNASIHQASIHQASTDQVELRIVTSTGDESPGNRPHTRTAHILPSGQVIAESVIVHGGGHTWFGGDPRAGHTDPLGPDASAELVRFFLEQPTPDPEPPTTGAKVHPWQHLWPFSRQR